MQFMELGTMNALLTREKSSDRLVRGIDVFDSFGQIIYSTDRLRVVLQERRPALVSTRTACRRLR